MPGDQARVARAPLSGRIFDASGAPMSPAFSQGRGGRVYRYYVSSFLQRGARPARDGILRRLPAPAIEALVERWMADITGKTASDHLLRLDVERGRLVLTLATRVITRDSIDGCVMHPRPDGTTRIVIPVSPPLRGGMRSLEAGLKTPQPDPNLVAALRRAHAMLGKAADGGPTLSAAPTSWYDRRVLRLAFLAPDLQRAILAGTQPRHVNLEFLVHSEIPLAWGAQSAALHWGD